MSRRRAHGPVQAQMTPLIDVVFLLIVFFVLVSRIVDEDRPRLDLPAPIPSATLVPPQGSKVIVSIVPVDGGVWRYHVAGVDVPDGAEGVDLLERLVGEQLERDPNTAVQIRAGRDTPWQVVAPVLEATREAGRAANLPQPVRVQLATVRSQGV